MDISNLLTSRLHNQKITSPASKPEHIVQWLGAIQAQDFNSAKWAIGLRVKNLTDQDIENAFNQGTILRTHVMRPTWHFVTPHDIAWMLTLTKNRVHKLNSYYYKQSGLDQATLTTYSAFIRKELAGNTYLTREEIGEKLIKAFNITKNKNFIIGLLLMYAELEGIICSGPRKQKQFTYALLEERVPYQLVLDIDHALAQLTLRYFQSHGPATIQDFVWWSGLTMRDAKKGIELNKATLHQESIEDRIYWFVTNNNIKNELTMYLLPNYDEYIVGYKNRSDIFDNQHTHHLDARANPLFQHTIILDGKVIGTWKREFKENSVTLRTNTFQPLGGNEEKLLEQAIQQFGRFTNKSITIETV